MKEFEIVASVALYLLKKPGWKIDTISIQNLKQREIVKKFLIDNGIEKSIIDKISFKPKEEDILAFYRGTKGKIQKHVTIEAKGESKNYNIYTAFGQFICITKSPSSYYWFGFAFPHSWRRIVKKRLLNSDSSIKPVITLLNKNLTKTGQGLYFYFVKADGTVIKETWRETLTRD